MNNNFGKINRIFVKSIVANKNNKKLIKEYVDFIKSNKSLLKEYFVYNTIENGTTTQNVERFINESIEILSNIDKKELKKLHEGLITILKNNNIETNDLDSDNKLYESIEYLIFNKPSVKNLNERLSAFENINECICKYQKLDENIKEQHINNDFLYKIMINNFNKKYNDKLTESEKKLFKEIILNTKDCDKKTIFENYKSECLLLSDKLLNENKDEETTNILLQVREKLNEQLYNKETYFQDITNLHKLKTTFS